MKINKFWNWREPTDSTAARTLVLDGPIASESWWGDEVTPKAFKKELNTGKGDIEVWINSGGGDCIAAAQIYNMLKDYKGNVTVKIDGIAASAASVIAMAGDTVEISPVGLMMIHDPMTVAAGNTEDMEKAIDMLNEVKESIMNAYETKTGIDRQELAALMSAETWMNAKAALEKGFVDKIIGAPDAAPTNSIMYSQAAYDAALKNKIADLCRIEKKPEGKPVNQFYERLAESRKNFNY